MMSFVVDTSAFLSLESVSLLETIIKNFEINTSPGVTRELGEFAEYDDELGTLAQHVLIKKEHLIVEKPPLEDRIIFVSETDNELFNLARLKKSTLITDDIKLTRHCVNKIRTEFSTYFLIAFVETGFVTKQEGIKKLEKMRQIRNWQDNIIYLTAKEELEKIE